MTENNIFSLIGKTILVTGASSGIGRSVAIECSKSGAEVIISGRDESKLLSTYNLLNNKADNGLIVADLRGGAQELVNSLKPVDGVVHCAGMSIISPIQFSSRDSIESIINLNYMSWAELSCLLFKNRLIKSGGSIVAIASVASEKITYGSGIYGASKAAMITWNKYCALEFASRKIRVNSISPGTVETPLLQKNGLTSEQWEESKHSYPLKRFGTPEEIAYAAIYLLSDAARWITGTNMVIDGGLSLK